MKKSLIFIFSFLLIFLSFAKGQGNDSQQDTSQVIELNKQAYAIHLTNPEQTVSEANKALAIAQRIGFTNGVGEAYREMGIGYYYLNQPKKAVDSYLSALATFTNNGNLKSEAKVYNNIGILYLDNDYDKSLEFFNKALSIATKLSDKHTTASLYFNIGGVYYRNKNFNQALNYYIKSNEMFIVLKDSVNLVQCLQNKGVIYFYLNQYDKAESLLLEAIKEAKQLDLNKPVASIDLTLADLYIAKNRFNDAEKTVQEGFAFSKILKDEKLESDFEYTSYQLELKRKNYEQALHYLITVYKLDSAAYKQNTSTQITLMREEVNQQARQKENELLLQRQKYDLVKFWAVAIVAGLLLVLVGLLIYNVKRKAKTNIQLTNLNAEVSRQKDNLDRINHHLEEIIDERTKDLQVKNKKLSEYSSYLSHQIRGPIATLKGLLNLEKEGLVDQPECIRMMNKSVSEIDDKIIEMSDMLHDPGRAGF
jgi:tetratricopeptide (TPR) repeat protein